MVHAWASTSGVGATRWRAAGTARRRADREVLRVSQSRAGFDALDAWLGRQPEPVTRS